MPKQGEIGGRISSGSLELVFEWREDRFVHRIATRAASSASSYDLITSSTEAGGFDTPVFQEVHQQGELVFASGMSGDRHWSASVESTDEGLLLDVACRVKELPTVSLGSAYTDWDKKWLTVVGKPADDSPPPVIETTAKVVTISAAIDKVPLPATFRYRYALIGGDESWVNQIVD